MANKFKVGDRVVIILNEHSALYVRGLQNKGIDVNQPRLITKIKNTRNPYDGVYYLSEWTADNGYLFERELKLVKKPTILIKMRDKNV